MTREELLKQIEEYLPSYLYDEVAEQIPGAKEKKSPFYIKRASLELKENKELRRHLYSILTYARFASDQVCDLLKGYDDSDGFKALFELAGTLTTLGLKLPDAAEDFLTSACMQLKWESPEKMTLQDMNCNDKHVLGYIQENLFFMQASATNALMLLEQIDPYNLERLPFLERILYPSNVLLELNDIVERTLKIKQAFGVLKKIRKMNQMNR